MIASNILNFESLNKLMLDYHNDYGKILEDVTTKLRSTAETLYPSNISYVTINGGQAYENEKDVLVMILSFSFQTMCLDHIWNCVNTCSLTSHGVLLKLTKY